MGMVTIRIDDDLKDKSYTELERLGVTPSELIRQTLQYVVEQKKLPFKSVILSDDDIELLAIAKNRLANPQPVKVNLDDL